ncbi:hypothetical protein GCM10023079_48290 [Streptomyces chitinivorans]|uniref:eCIS core domain-containing protein n=1 Tax=Streptomyces chitinivorans TaxID=1257027 RepID=UPI003380AAF4
MQRSRQRAERSEDRQPASGRAAARREAPGGGAAVPPPLTAAALRAAQRGVGNAAAVGMIARRAAPAVAPEQPDTGVHEVLRSAGKPLAAPVRREMEARFGTDFSDVRLHTGATAARSARAIGARAYTSGSHVVIGDGGGDRHTLAHELTHVVQQRQGPVSGTDHGDGLRVSDPSDRFEREAEANATRVMRAPLPAADASPAPAPEGRRTVGEAVQRALDYTANPSGRSFSGRTDGSGRAVAAAMLTDGHLKGSPPFQDPPGYDYIRSLGLTNRWIRFHLVNNEAGGPGSADNLVPASQSDNQTYERNFENALKQDVTAAAAAPGDYVYFGVEVQYGNVAPATASAAQQAAAPNFPTQLAVYHKFFTPATGWTWRHNGQVFRFNTPQPADTRAPMQLSALTLPVLKQYTSFSNSSSVWDQNDVDFLHSIATSRRTEFTGLLGGMTGDDVLRAFELIPFAPPRPNARQAASGANVTTFWMRVANHKDGETALESLAFSIASGVLRL